MYLGLLAGNEIFSGTPVRIDQWPQFAPHQKVPALNDQVIL